MKLTQAARDELLGRDEAMTETYIMRRMGIMKLT